MDNSLLFGHVYGVIKVKDCKILWKESLITFEYLYLKYIVSNTAKQTAEGKT